MSDVAAHLVDRVIPYVPLRQWVLTFSPRVRWHLADDPKLTSEALTLFTRALFNFQRRRARQLGIKLSRAEGSGAITFIQRFNSALSLSVHFHTLVPDGVFVPPSTTDIEARPRFVRLDPPVDEEVEALLGTIIIKVHRMLERRGRFEDAPPRDPEDPLRAAYALAARSPKTRGGESGDSLPPLCARKDGFSLHAGRAVHENDRAGLEQLCRYGARPALSVDRLRVLDDGRVQYQMKRTFSDGTSAITFAPQEFIARLCALIPPARRNQTRYHGIFAPRARRRAALTGRESRPRTPTDPRIANSDTPSPSPLSPTPDPSTPPDLGDRPPSPERAVSLPWADLLRRVHSVDVKTCPDCGGRLRVIAFITDPDVTRAILEHLGLPSKPPPRAPPRAAAPRQYDIDDYADPPLDA